MKKLISILFVLSMLFLCADSYSQISSLDYSTYRAYQTPSTPPFVSKYDKVPADIRNRNFFRRFDWFYRQRLNELGVFPKEFIDSQKDIELSKSNYDNPLYQWTNLGPVGVDMSATEVPHWGINSGRIRGLAVHPSNPDVAYIGAASGGIWKTTNGGLNWSDKSGDFNMITFGSIAIDHFNPNIIYAGTGESAWYIFYNMYSGDGLYKSTDAGEHWFKINSDFGIVTHFSDIVVSPHNPNVLLVALAVSYLNPYPNQGIWRSSNAGLNWTRVVNITGAFDLAFHPVNPNLVYAATGNKQPLGGFLVSTDGGNTFNQSNAGLPPFTSMGRLQFDISQSNPSVLYCLVHDISPVSGGMNTCAYKSTNGGAFWFQISTGVNIAGTYDGTTATDQGDYDLCITVNPANPDNVFIGNVELSRTVNGSSISFLRKPDGPTNGTTALDCYTHLDIHNIKFAPSNPSVIYIGCDGGIYKSTNSGVSFSHFNNGINSIQLYTVASHPTNPDIIYGGSQDNGGFRTVDRGATSWVDNVSGDGMKCFVDYSNPNIVFIATIFGTLSRSTNGGTNWSEIIPQDMDSTSFRSDYWQHPVNPNIIYGAYKRKIYKSTNKGNAWAFTTSTPVANANIYTVAQSKVNPLNMILITNDIPADVYRSSDEGYTWTNITANGNFAGASLMNVKADPMTSQTFYVLRGSYTTGQILKTTNFGNNWTDISSDLPKIPVSDIFVDSANASVMYLGNDFGVYRSTNSGGNWARLNNGFPFVPVMEFSLYNFSNTRLLRAATYGRGVFELNLNQPISVNDPTNQIPKDFILNQNYPNPFNPTTLIRFGIPSLEGYVQRGVGMVTLKVYDITGREVQTLVNEKLQPGSYEVTFNGSRLTSGVYFCKLSAGKYFGTKKMIILK
ncbi:MAG: VPS10 domain-containing protein [Ignavibacteria bacterium]